MKRRGAVRAGAVGAAVLLVAGALSPAAAQETKSKRVVLTLRDAVKTAVARSPEVKSTAFDVEALLGKKQQADAARFPQISSLGAIGPSPEAERKDPSGLPTALKSINAREGTLTSAFGSADILLIQPIYTFGLISNLRAAAEHGVNAQDLKGLIGDLHEQLLKAADRQETLLEGGFASEQDLFKLRTYQGELEKNPLVEVTR
jgi:outer membrane protein TolC